MNGLDCAKCQNLDKKDMDGIIGNVNEDKTK